MAALGRELSGEVGAETPVKGVASPAKSRVKLAVSARGRVLSRPQPQRPSALKATLALDKGGSTWTSSPK